jgi:predicted nucleotidyltransferase
MIKSKEEILNFLSLRKNFLRKNFHVVKLGLFGSFARGDNESGSDIDLIVEFEENTQNLFDLKRKLKAYLKENLNLEVDICREKYIKPRYKKAILTEAQYVN